MKTKRFLLALAALTAVAACSGDATAPEPALLTPDAAPAASTEPVQPSTTDPTNPDPGTGGGGDTGTIGSGCCVKP